MENLECKGGFFPLTGALTVFSDYDTNNVKGQICLGVLIIMPPQSKQKNKIKNFVEGSQ